ncbi:MAG: BatD family protein [Spirochaetes bacterium]|nr:BatD family protein [Spirochaetota bacterium]
MTVGSLTNRGRIVAALAALLIVGAASPGQLETVLEQSVISAGDSTMLRVTFTRGENIEPLKVPRVPGVDISYAGMQRNIEIINWKQSASVVISFALRGERPGTYAIPPFHFRTDAGNVSSRQVILKVVPGPVASGAERGDGSGRLATKVQLSKNSVYVGEPVVMNYYILSSGVNFSLDGFQKNPSADGFVIQQIDAEQTQGTEKSAGGDITKTRITAYALIPARTGSFYVGGGLGVISTDMPDQFSFFGRPLPFNQQRTIGFDTLPVRVNPLPPGAPDTFQGDVGIFTLSSEYETGDVRVFQEKRVKVIVSGSGNFISMSRPRLEHDLPEVKVIVEEGEPRYRVSDGGLEGTKKFTVTLIPTKAGKVDAGSVAMTYFNPRTGRYETARSGPISFLATGDGAAGRMGFDSDRGQTVDFNPVLIGAGAVLVGGALALFILWERKRFRMVRRETEVEESDAVGKNGEDAVALVLRELDDSYRADDRGAFLQRADRALALAARDAAGESLDLIKDRVYFFRYGGGTIDRAAMEEILKGIRVILGRRG